jgi:hypothetical protein
MCFLQERPEHGISKASYMQAVLAGQQEYRAAAAAAATLAAGDAGADSNSSSRQSGGILVKFLLSIDRRNDTAAALDTVSLRCGAKTSEQRAQLQTEGWCMILKTAHSVDHLLPKHTCEQCIGTGIPRRSMSHPVTPAPLLL